MMGVDKIWFVTLGMSDPHRGHQRATPSKCRWFFDPELGSVK